MLLYLEYEQLKQRFADTQQMMHEILLEKEELFLKTQPKSVKYDSERVAGGDYTNAFDEYVIAKEKRQIDERLQEARQMVEDRKELLRLKEQELRQSRNVTDKIYRMRFLDRIKVHRIASMIGYSEASVYRVLHTISETLRKR